MSARDGERRHDASAPDSPFPLTDHEYGVPDGVYSNSPIVRFGELGGGAVAADAANSLTHTPHC